MIDIEPIVYTTVHDAIIAAFPECTVSDLPPEATAKFPFVSIQESGNRTYRRSLDTDLYEHHATVVYDINVYSDKQVGRKSECKAILNVADHTMQSMKFVRIMKNELPTVNRTIMRMHARYEAVVEEPEIDGDNKTFQMYRR